MTRPTTDGSGHETRRVDPETLAQGLDECLAPKSLLSSAEVEELSQVRPRTGVDDPVTLLDPHELCTWVDWLRATYPVHDRIPDRWPEVPAVLAELHGLHLAHLAATTNAGVSLPDWHETFQRALHRIERWTNDTRKVALIRTV
jgi:hypothetical protein